MKECPQCEDTPELNHTAGGYNIECPFCGFMTVDFATEYDAVSAWDEVYEIIEMRSTVVARVLAKELDKDIENYCKVTSLTILAQYLQAAHENGQSWNQIKGNLYKQVKVTELSYDRLKRKIDVLRADSLGG